MRILASSGTPKPSRAALEGQPFDRHLLELSPLYRRSRALFLASGGTFAPSLVTSPRSLSSVGLLSPRIEYTPHEKELLWSATDPIQSRDPSYLLTLRTYSSSLFHEQNHRILWKKLPRAPRDPKGLGRYLNFAEACVIALDMALGDELGPELAAVFYLSGTAYDPGTWVRKELGRTGSPKRAYRNYLQAACFATCLTLERYRESDIRDVIRALFPTLGELASRAAARASRLDREFIDSTNAFWQEKHREAALRALSKRAGKAGPLELPADPGDIRLQYLFCEKWFELFGL